MSDAAMAACFWPIVVVAVGLLAMAIAAGYVAGCYRRERDEARSQERATAAHLAAACREREEFRRRNEAAAKILRGEP